MKIDQSHDVGTSCVYHLDFGSQEVKKKRGATLYKRSIRLHYINTDQCLVCIYNISLVSTHYTLSWTPTDQIVYLYNFSILINVILLLQGGRPCGTLEKDDRHTNTYQTKIFSHC